MAVPKEVPEAAQKMAYLTSNARLHAAGDLTVIAFYFLLRSGEYTKPRRVTRNGKMVRATRTIQFRVCDVGFWKDNTILSRKSTLNLLLSADSATRKITNQKKWTHRTNATSRIHRTTRSGRGTRTQSTSHPQQWRIRPATPLRCIPRRCMNIGPELWNCDCSPDRSRGAQITR